MAREHLLDNRVPPPVVGVVAALVQRSLPRRDPATWRRATAAGVTAGAAALALAAERHFGRHHTTVNPLSPDKASSLVTGGPYELTRNPMYVAMAGVLVAHAVARGHLAALLPVGAWTAYIDRFQVRPEERALEGVFGAEYAAYRQRVRRWV